MFTHPAITVSLAEQRRRDLITQASACRQARAARQSRSRNPVRRPLIVKALGAAAAAAAITTAAFLVTPAGPGHTPAAHGMSNMHYRGHSHWVTSHRGDVQYVVHSWSRWS